MQLAVTIFWSPSRRGQNVCFSTMRHEVAVLILLFAPLALATSAGELTALSDLYYDCNGDEWLTAATGWWETRVTTPLSLGTGCLARVTMS